MEKTYDLSRFMIPHQKVYESALREIQKGRKQTHWMWYIFPQIQGLGRSATSKYYAIQDIGEAIAFLQDPFLGQHIREISQTLLDLETDDAYHVFGAPDDKKLHSSMTLFACASNSDLVFEKVLDKFFDGKKDDKTLRILAKNQQNN